MLLLIGIVAGQFNTGAIIGLVIILLLIFCSAMISGSEVAFFSLTPAHQSEIESEKAHTNQLIEKLLNRPKYLIATILIANNFINVAIVVLSSYLTLSLFNFSTFPILGFIVQVVVITSVILLFGEIMPKIYAANHALKLARFMAVPIKTLEKVFFPLAKILVKSTSIIDKRVSKRAHSVSISELSDAIDITTTVDTPEDEKKILKGIVTFGDIEAKEIMKARIDVTAIEENTSFSDLLNIVLDSGYSRIPVYHESFDKIIGILYIKDLLPYLDDKEKEFKWQSLLRPAFFVPENKKINDLLQEFRLKKIHLAIVVDEYGGTSGIITLEDILEEIVGEINDEFDLEGEGKYLQKIDDKSWIFEGKTSLNDFFKVVSVEDNIFDEVKGEFDTLAGLILELEGTIPEKNLEIRFKRFIFRIESVDKRRIKRIKVTVVDEE